MSSTLTWEHPTIDALARYLGTDTLATTPTADVSPDAAVGEPLAIFAEPLAIFAEPLAIFAEPLAIFGMACRFPGGATDLDSYWALLERGHDAIAEVPADRWDAHGLYAESLSESGTINTRWAGLLDRRAFESFDAAYFGISPREAKAIDPQQRLALELGYEALEDSGLDPNRLVDRRIGVFIGAMWSDYARRAAIGHDRIGPHTATGMDTSIISARVSYTLGLRGPSITVNTACSSSLVAIHLACQSIRSGDCELALVGGVHVMAGPESGDGSGGRDGPGRPLQGVRRQSQRLRTCGGWRNDRHCTTLVRRRAQSALHHTRKRHQ